MTVGGSCVELKLRCYTAVIMVVKPACMLPQAHTDGSVAVKPDPDATGNGHLGPRPTELSSGGSSDGDESESESAELRRAAAAYATTNRSEASPSV